MRSRGIRVCAVFLIAALLLTTATTMLSFESSAKKTKLKTKRITIKVGKKKKISLKGKKGKHKYSFVSKNKRIAKVSKKGVVTGIKKGKTKITVKDIWKVKGKKKTKKIGVVNVTVKKNDKKKVHKSAAPKISTKPSGKPKQSNTPGTTKPSASPGPTNSEKPTATPTQTVVEPPNPYAPEKEQNVNETTLNLTKSFNETSDGKITNNPLFTQSFMADPTAVEYDGRLYIYGTHDIISFSDKGLPVKNVFDTDEIHVISSADLINWTDHGTIDVGEAAPWAQHSWAPSITKKEVDGKTKFYLYFANGGNGIGVIEGDSPLGPWKAPSDKPLISRDTPTCSAQEVPWLFDPAVLVDDDGSAYLYFGGGTGVQDSDSAEEAAKKNKDPKSARVVKLGADMVSLDGSPVEINPQYLFEDSEINKINGKYVYSYCTNWSEEGSKIFGTGGAISYMVSDNPMSGFAQKGTLFANPGKVFGNYANNHHKIIEFKGEHYIIYHTTILEKAMFRTNRGYRTLHMDKLNVQETNGELTITAEPTYEGVEESVGMIDAYEEIDGTTMAWNGGLQSVKSKSLGKTVVDSINTGDWMGIRQLNYGLDGAEALAMSLASDTAIGMIEVYVDGPSAAKGGKKIGELQLVNTGGTDVYKKIYCELTEKVSGKHDTYFVFRGKGYHISSWNFMQDKTQIPKPETPEETYEVPKGFDRKIDNVKYGEMTTATYSSTTTGADRKVNILLPANYTTQKKYPVLYLLHGIGGDQNEWKGGNPAYVIGNLVVQGMAKEMIVVMPNVRARKNDSGSSDLSLEHFAAFDNFINDLRDDLMPFIKKNYSILEGRENTAIAGLSMGGRESLYIGVTMADTFGYIGAFSPAVGVLPYSSNVTESGLFTEETFKLAPQYNGKTFLMICNGTQDTIVYDTPEQYHKVLEKNGTVHTYYETKGGHDFVVWKHGLYNFTRRIF